MKTTIKTNDVYEAPVSVVYSVSIPRGICDVSGDNEEVSETEGQW